MSHRTRPSARALVAVLAALALPLSIAAIPLSASAEEEIPTSTSVVTDRPGYTYGDQVVLTATVTADTGTPTGTVTFRDDTGDVVATDVPLGANGTAVAQTTADFIGPMRFHADFHGTNGYADSTAFTFTGGIRSGIVLDPEPSVLEISRRNPLKVTLTLSAYARTPDGRPVVGESLTFSVLGRQPNLFDFGGGTVICRAVTDADGFATCGGAGLGGAVVSLLAGGSYVTHFRELGYEFASAKAKVIVLGGP